MTRLLIAAALAGTLGCAAQAAPPGSGPSTLIGVAGRWNATPSLAARGTEVAVTWTAADADGGHADVFAATSADGGHTFSKPVRVNTSPGTVRNSGEQAPRVALGAASIVVVWAARDNGQSAIMYAESFDHGRTFSVARPVHAAHLPGLRGWPSVATDAGGRIHVLWLDGRSADHPGTGAMAMDHGADAHMMPAGMHHESPRQDVFEAEIDADGRISERPVAQDVCFCCKTALAVRPDGSIFAAWRHIFPGSLHDIGATTFSPGDRHDPVISRISDDGWRVDGCPEDGPAAAADTGGTIHIVWPTLVDGRKGVFYAHTADGHTFSPRQRVDAANAGASHPQLTIAGQRAVVVWDEPAGTATRVMIRTLNLENGRWTNPTPLTNAIALYPVVAASGDAVIAAWTSRTATASRITVLPFTPSS